MATIDIEFHTLYHITPRQNVASISDVGISPAFARSRRSCVWLVDDERIPWALAHLSERDGLPVAEYIVLTVAAPAPELRKTSWRGVYQSLVSLYPTYSRSASQALAQWDAERRVGMKAHKL